MNKELNDFLENIFYGDKQVIDIASWVKTANAIIRKQDEAIRFALNQETDIEFAFDLLSTCQQSVLSIINGKTECEGV